MGVGFLYDNRPMLRGSMCMIVVSCGDVWWNRKVVVAPLARYLAISHTYAQSKLTHHPQAHMQDRLTTPFSRASKVAPCSASSVAAHFLCASSVADMQAKLRTSVVDMWGIMWTNCGSYAAGLRDGETK